MSVEGFDVYAKASLAIQEMQKELKSLINKIVNEALGGKGNPDFSFVAKEDVSDTDMWCLRQAGDGMSKAYHQLIERARAGDNKSVEAIIHWNAEILELNEEQVQCVKRNRGLMPEVA